MIEICYQDQYLVAVNKPAGRLAGPPQLAGSQGKSGGDADGARHVGAARVYRAPAGSPDVLLMALSAEVSHRLAQQFEGHQSGEQTVFGGHLQLSGW